jgi:hypothetical protein
LIHALPVPFIWWIPEEKKSLKSGRFEFESNRIEW